MTRAAARGVLLAVAAVAGVAALGRMLGAPPNDPSQPAGSWFAFSPSAEPAGDQALDLRSLNEDVAGEGGFIGVRDGSFVRSGTGQPVRFWGVNGPPPKAEGEVLRRCARTLARHGVNLVRIHAPYFDEAGELDPVKVRHAIEVVEALKAEGIYAAFSIYYPLWLHPAPGTPWLPGYDGHTSPFATLFFNREFQARYRTWWKALLLTPSPRTGRRLVDDPAVAAVEIQNEDSLFFPTFEPDHMPEAQVRILEHRFGDWLARRHGSAAAALERWAGHHLARDAPGEGRIAVLAPGLLARDRSARAQETARFLLEVQTQFYLETRDFLRELGFRGVIGASNWQTASPDVLGPLEKLSYTVGDFVDRHAYLSSDRAGPDAAWALRVGQTYQDRGGLRLSTEELAGGLIDHPAPDTHYDGMPSMLSEASWERPSRHRAEAALLLAATGALQHSDAIVHFALDGCDWSTSPRPAVQQPWTLMSPAMMGQFPAAALIFRRGLVAPGQVVATVALEREALKRLEGIPGAPGAAVAWDRTHLDPLLHFAGRVDVRFTDGPGWVRTADVGSLVDHAARTVRSTTGEVRLDYGNGLLTIDASRAQGAVGDLRSGSPVETRDLTISSPLGVGQVVAVALDDLPLATSRRILLQVMSEERPSGFTAGPVRGGRRVIEALGTDPWLVREIVGTVRFKRADAARLHVQELDPSGRPGAQVGDASVIQLRPTTLRYLITG